MAVSVNAMVVSALKPFGLPVAERMYRGEQDEYFFFVLADDTLADAGDDMPQAYLAFVHVHYVCPLDKPYSHMRRRIRAALVNAGFTPPEVTDVSDLTSEAEAERVRHLVFETSIENDYDLEV